MNRCLCVQQLPKDRRKRKKLSGSSCINARKVLRSLSGPVLDNILGDHDAVICTSCDNTLNNIYQCEQKLTSLKRSMMEKSIQMVGC